MKMRIFLCGMLMAQLSFAESTQEAQQGEKVSTEKTSLADAKIPSQSEIGPTTDTRMRVEGATFKPFNLYLAPTKITSAVTESQKKTVNEIRSIIERDLQIVGTFNFVKHTSTSTEGDFTSLLRQKGAEGISQIGIGFSGDNINVSVENKNLMSGLKKSFPFKKGSKELRQLAHLVSQSIFEMFIGPEDLFVTQVAAIKMMNGGNQVVLLDFDGHNETLLTEGNWPKTAPYFTPDGKGILYTVVTPQGQGIVEQEIGSKRYQFRIRKAGLNLDARIFPDNSGMLATLSYEKDPNIYRATRTGAIIGKVLPLGQGLGMNLSPSISPDGTNLAFVSDRSGTPQIYVTSLQDKNAKAKRVTSQGKYNQTPHFSPDGNLIAFTGRDENKIFDIFLVEHKTSRISRITEHQGRNQEPHFTASGRFVIFTSVRDGKKKPDIFIASLNGNHQFRLTNAEGDARSKGYMTPIVRPKHRGLFTSQTSPQTISRDSASTR